MNEENNCAKKRTKELLDRNQKMFQMVQAYILKKEQKPVPITKI